jgi:hypothetical protein
LLLNQDDHGTLGLVGSFGDIPSCDALDENCVANETGMRNSDVVAAQSSLDADCSKTNLDFEKAIEFLEFVAHVKSEESSCVFLQDNNCLTSFLRMIRSK